MADVRTTGYLRVIQDKLFEGYDFVKKSQDLSQFVSNKTVEIPNAGVLPDVIEDRSVFPIPVTQRTDDKQTFDLIEFSLGAVVKKERDKWELSYDVRASILKQHIDQLNDAIGKRAAYNWGVTDAVSAKILRTTGTATANIAPTGATGNRKALLLADLVKAKALIHKDNFDVTVQDKMNILMPADVYYNFLIENKTELNALQRNGSNYVIPTGAVDVILGMNVYVKPTSLSYTNDSTPVKKAVGAASATTDNHGILVWHSDAACNALGAIKPFVETDSPVYQGDVYSAQVRFNAVAMRSAYAGFCTIVQAQ